MFKVNRLNKNVSESYLHVDSIYESPMETPEQCANFVQS